MLYYYHTHRRPLDRTSYKNGKTGYFGVLQELISEVPLERNESAATQIVS